jgi:hypothetical protein
MKVIGIVTLSCVLVPFTALEARPSDDGFVVQSELPASAGGAALHWAVVGAHRRLEQPACQRLFAEFTDASNRTLQENLDALGETGASYLGLIRFADGTDRPRCKKGDALAFTRPGSHVVYVCGRPFKNLVDRSPTTAQAIVIHEALHTLGLGENPPSSADITATVMARCR